jgi:hypothetical protein
MASATHACAQLFLDFARLRLGKVAKAIAGEFEMV